MAATLRIARCRPLLATPRLVSLSARFPASRSNSTASSRPHTLLQPHESLVVPSQTDPTKSYAVKRVGDQPALEYYTCSCMAWKMQRGKGLKERSCKHLKALLGEEFETARLKAFSRSPESVNQNFDFADSLDIPSKPGSHAAHRSPFASFASTSTLDGRRHFSTSLRSLTKKAAVAGFDKPVKAPTKRKAAVPKVKKEVVELDVSVPMKREVSVLLAKKFELGGKISPVGYWVSEKLDGIRAFWDGDSGLWSRVGNRFHAPEWYLRQLPQGVTLDGELYHSRGNFSSAISIVRSHSMQNWEQIRYKVFDIPFNDGYADPPTPNPDVFEERIERLHSMFDPLKASETIVDVVPQTLCLSLENLIEQLKEVEQQGGEGLMLREPRSLYVAKRSSTLLKVKTFFDAEAVVIGYEPGKGKYAGQTGSLICRMESGREFSCGSGMIDTQRVDPPPIGAIVTYRFQEMTKDSIPRFPVFVGERIDADGPKDADVSRKSVASSLASEE